MPVPAQALPRLTAEHQLPMTMEPSLSYCFGLAVLRGVSAADAPDWVSPDRRLDALVAPGKVAAAGLDNLILVVYRGLAVGTSGAALEGLTATVGPDRLVWFAKRPRAADVVRAAAQHAR